MDFLRYCVNVSGRKCRPPNIAIDAAMTLNCIAIQCAMGSSDIDYGGSCSFWELRSDTQEILIRFMCLITSHWLMSPELVGVSISMRDILFLFSIASKIARTCRHHPTGCAGVDSEARLKFVFFARLLRPSLGSLLGTTPCLLLGRVELEETYCYSSQRSGDP